MKYYDCNTKRPSFGGVLKWKPKKNKKKKRTTKNNKVLQKVYNTILSHKRREYRKKKKRKKKRNIFFNVFAWCVVCRLQKHLKLKNDKYLCLFAETLKLKKIKINEETKLFYNFKFSMQQNCRDKKKAKNCKKKNIKIWNVKM